MNEAETLWQTLLEERPLAARLALLTCLPVRVSPAFLRLARLRLLPGAGTGDEADLWLSDLVETKSSGGLSYRREVRNVMRQRLAGEADLLGALWHQVHLEHAAWLGVRGRLEEELTWRLLRDSGDAWIEQQWQAVLAELEAAGSQVEGVARWVVRAMADLPSGSLDHRSGQRAFYGAHLLLGNASVLGDKAQVFVGSNDFAFATRRLPRRRVFVGRIEMGALISPLRAIENGFDIDIPATRPLWVQLEDGGHEPFFEPEVVLIDGNEAVSRVVGSDAVTIRLLDGSAYAIGPQRSSTEKVIARNREPWVQIEFDFELYGAIKKVHLPFVMGVLADLSGNPVEPLPDVTNRDFVEYDIDSFDSHIKMIRPRVAFQVPIGGEDDRLLRVALVFEAMDDFAPAHVARQVEPFSALLDVRAQLANLITFLDGKPTTEDALAKMLSDSQLCESVARGDKLGDKFVARILKEFKPTNHEARSAVELALRALAKQALSAPKLISNDVAASIEAIVAMLDGQLSTSLCSVLHHPEFQRLESAWRGLHYLVTNTETDESLKIRVLNISKADLAEALKPSGSDAWDQCPLFMKVHEETFGQFGGEPFGCLVGDYHFSHHREDVELLTNMAKVCAAAFAPFIAGADPSLMQMRSWQELANPRDLSSIFSAPEYAAWHALRASDDARYLALAMPRFLARLPYASVSNPIEEFAFEEDTASADVFRFTWANSAYAMAANINRAFANCGWCARIGGIEAGGVVENLPTYTFPTADGGMDQMSPTEIAVNDRREAELARNGLLPLVHRKNTDFAVFIGAQSLQKPPEYDDPDATANAALAARLPYVFAVCRFSHYLKCIVRDNTGSFRDDQDMARWLNNWILQYVDGDPEASSQEAKARKPLMQAEIVVEPVEGEPGSCAAKFFLRPHYQLEGLTDSLRMETRLPSMKST